MSCVPPLGESPVDSFFFLPSHANPNSRGAVPSRRLSLSIPYIFKHVCAKWLEIAPITAMHLQGWGKEMGLSWEKVSARLQPATAGHARLVLSKTAHFFCTSLYTGLEKMSGFSRAIWRISEFCINYDVRPYAMIILRLTQPSLKLTTESRATASPHPEREAVRVWTAVCVKWMVFSGRERERREDRDGRQSVSVSVVRLMPPTVRQS